MTEQDTYLATSNDIIELTHRLNAAILHYMALLRIIVLFLVTLPFNIALFVLTHLLILLVSVFRDTALLVGKFYLDFQQARGTRR